MLMFVTLNFKIVGVAFLVLPCCTTTVPGAVYNIYKSESSVISYNIAIFRELYKTANLI